MSRNYLVVAHPQTGKKRRLGKILSLLDHYFDINHLDHDIFYTRQDFNGSEVVRRYLQEAHTDIIAIGGDGTLNEVINGFDDERLVFSFIANGSGNDFAKNFYFESLEHQVRNALVGPIRQMDLGICNERKFINGVGIGLDGQVIYDLLHKKNVLHGAYKYYYHVVRNLLSYRSKPFEYRVDHTDHQKSLLLLCIANGTTFGNGFKLTPNADLFDGLLDVCEITKLRVLKRLVHIPKLSKGTHHKLQEVELYHAREVMIAANKLLHAHIDGEYMGAPPYHIRVLPKSLRIRLPEHSK